MFNDDNYYKKHTCLTKWPEDLGLKEKLIVLVW